MNDAGDNRGSFGIEAMDVYGGSASISAQALFAGRGLDPQRFDNVVLNRRAVALPFEDPVTHAVNAARPLLDRIPQRDRNRIELLVTTTESGIDYSKSVSTYVHEHLGLGRNCRLLEMKQACYSATGALQLAVGHLAAGISPGAKALIISTDISLADERAQYAEPATGTGAVALLVGDRPRVLAVDLGAFGLYSFETLDSARPLPDLDIADADRSLLAYLECLSHSFADYRTRVEGADFATTFDQLALHTPFSGMVRAGHRRLMRELYATSPKDIQNDYERRVEPSLTYPGEVGNLFSGSLYLALASLIDHAPLEGPARVGLFSYGSGCSSEFFSGVVGPDSAAEVGRAGIKERLANRAELTFAEYTELLSHTLGCLRPVSDRTVDPAGYGRYLDRVVDRPKMLALTGVEGYHRHYEWI
ncbi:3-hydroxy-3-methylglutaryl-ACP synthase [Streptomyces sp. CB01201]|uniref:hydroxymethylglutaryl-CoA synthase family protein n=1 Tax=unclassified Streptomyces TaxID=2593676 RepID=UPI000C277D57|nr:hydroxymethylglutaryl-CoA synthase [Streptomyces sp. CB01201]PJN02062.1 3-hydroxy-3-methylglutaryl-ACP synthase [Streptomyces sp. CB01201]